MNIRHARAELEGALTIYCDGPLLCDCGADDLIAVKPGMRGERVGMLVLSEEERAAGFCAACWSRRFGHGSLAAE